MRKLNPNNEIIQAADDQWHKIVYIVMRKLGVENVDVTLEDVKRMSDESDKFAVCLDCRSHGKPGPTMTVRILPMAEAERLAKKEGGLPC
jgi:hypothetical protein